MFSGIGGFEVAIKRLHPNAHCIGYSDIDGMALSVYKKNFPDHVNLGDVRSITNAKILKAADNGCDLLVAGFPCNDLSGMNTNGKGLEGAKSGLFYEMLRIIKVLKGLNPNLRVVIENNASMAIKWRETITAELEKCLGTVHVIKIDAGDVLVQTRKRLFWTTKAVPGLQKKRMQSWKDVLEPVSSKSIVDDTFSYAPMVKYQNTMLPSRSAKTSLKAVHVKVGVYKFVNVQSESKVSRWSSYRVYSDTAVKNSRPVLTKSDACVLLDRRGCDPGTFRIRRFTVKELARLFTFDDNHAPEDMTVNGAYVTFAKAVVVKVVEHVVKHELKA